MAIKTYEEFLKFSLQVVQKFIQKNNLTLKYGVQNGKMFDFDEATVPEIDKHLYYIIGQNHKLFYIRFQKYDSDVYNLFLDNSEISLILDQNMNRLTSYPNEELNSRIDKIKGSIEEKLTTCLYMLWDISCFIVFLGSEPS